jgi:hypothetical protein
MTNATLFLFVLHPVGTVCCHRVGSNPDELGEYVSQRTLEAFRAAWRSHAAAMDQHGRHFAKRVFHLHSEAVQVCTLLGMLHREIKKGSWLGGKV